MFSAVQPYQWVALRLPSDHVKIEQMIPNTTISLGKFGSFKTNHVLNRPYHLTWEILDKSDTRPEQEIRLVKASELHADTLLEEAESDLVGHQTADGDFDEYGLPGIEKSNVNIFDDPANQKLTLAEIESLKSDEMSNPKALIAKIVASHSSLDQKTAFSLAKYMLRKQKKYMKRFTVLPLDVSTMVDWIMAERDPAKIMELRNETIGLIGCWANVHSAGEELIDQSPVSDCRYLVVDDTGGLVVAALAERMGILHHAFAMPVSKDDESGEEEHEAVAPATTTESQPKDTNLKSHDPNLPTTNTIHLVHSNTQPNLSSLRYFNFDPNLPPTRRESNAHPLHTRLKLVSWLQLLDPEADLTYQEPAFRTSEELSTLKSNARASYHRKRRRWHRCKSIVDETRAGGFNGLVIASHTNPLSILSHLVPLLAGGAQIVVYNPSSEPLTRVVDAYSPAKRAAFLNMSDSEKADQLGGPDFPVDPSLTLSFIMHTARVRRWQVLPGRTHPLMTGQGGGEGYVAVGTRVLPAEGKVQARGKQKRGGKRRTAEDESVYLSDVEMDEIDSNEENGGEVKNKRPKVEAEDHLGDDGRLAGDINIGPAETAQSLETPL